MKGAPPASLDRRSFLAGTAGLSVAVSFGAPAFAATAASGFAPNAWVAVGADDIISIYSAQAEMGQGVWTTLPLLIAEEMDADWSKVRVLQSPSDAKVYGQNGLLGTFGSESTRSNYERLRLIGAQTRRILIINAAQLWGVPEAQVTTEPSLLVHASSGRRISYGAMARTARAPDPLPEVAKADLKPASAFRYVGKPLPRLDVPLKVNGAAIYGIDVQLPGQLYGAVLRPPVQGETAVSVDDKAARAMTGVVRVVTLPRGVGVIADTPWTAQKAKDALVVAWSSTSPARAYDSDRIAEAFGDIARDLSQQGVVMQTGGDVEVALGGAAKVVRHDYVTDHVAHLTMEPMNATARVLDGQVEIWASNQGPSTIQRIVGGLANVAPGQVQVHSTFLGGGFGRRYEGDYAADAYLLAREVPGRPVKLIWTREEDVRNDPYRPVTAQHIEVGLDAAGAIIAWRHRVVSSSYLGRISTARFDAAAGRDGVVAGGGGFGYAVPAHQVDYIRREPGVNIGAFRGISSGYMRFAIESTIDELARAQGADPLAYRKALLSQDARSLAVLEKVAQMSQWDRPREGRRLGLAFDDLGTRLAVAAEISVKADSGEIVVHNIWCAVDAGVAVQPVNLVAQIEGGLLFGMGPALFEQINIKAGEVAESNFSDYRVMRMADAPQVHVEMVITDNPPTGVGEAGALAIAPAIANAFAAHSGRRIRRLPMTPDRIKAVLA